jgi:hypothetical protein
MAERAPWGHVSRHCARCGKVGPRVSNPTGFGYIHAYCRTEEEKRVERQAHYANTKRLQALECERTRGVKGRTE